MKPAVIGAGLGRTGTFSLKLALERLLGGTCYHMVEVFQHPEHIASWHKAAEGDCSGIIEIIGGYDAAVDWPVAAFWKELSEAYPESLIVLSTRDPERWWDSAHSTIFRPENEERMKGLGEWGAMIRAVLGSRFTPNIGDKDACIAAFNQWNEEVRRLAPAERLLEWSAPEGWAPLCERLGVAIPDEPFPKANTKEEFLARLDPVADAVS